MSSDDSRLWRRDFRLLWGGSVVSHLGTISVATASPLLALSLTGSPVFAGWVTAAGTVPGLLLHLPAGWCADRFDRRKIILVSQWARLACVALFIAGFHVLRDPRLLLLAALLDGTCVAFYSIAESAAIRHVVPPGQRRVAFAKNEARIHIAQCSGRPLGGFLFGFGQLFPYVFDAISSIVSLGTIACMRKRSLHPFRRAEAGAASGPAALPGVYDYEIDHEDVAERKRGLRDGLLLVVRDPFLRMVLVVCGMVNFILQTVLLLLVVLAKGQGVSSAMIGVLLAASGMGGALGAMVAPRLLKTRPPGTIVRYCVGSWVFLLLIVAVTPSPVVGLIAWGSCSFMGAHVNVALAVHQASAVPRNLQGQVIGIVRLVTGGAVPLGALCGGYIIAALSPREAAWLAAAAMVLVASGVLGHHLRRTVRRTRRRRRNPAERGGAERGGAEQGAGGPPADAPPSDAAVNAPVPEAAASNAPAFDAPASQRLVPAGSGPSSPPLV